MIKEYSFELTDNIECVDKILSTKGYTFIQTTHLVLLLRKNEDRVSEPIVYKRTRSTVQGIEQFSDGKGSNIAIENNDKYTKIYANKNKTGFILLQLIEKV